MSYAPIRPRWLIALVACAAGLATPSPAGAQPVATATPSQPGGKPTRLSWDVDGLVAPVSARIPRTLVLTAPGFALDMKAVGGRCRKEQATLDECPKKSKIGTGLMKILVHRPIGPNELPIDITLYQGPKKSLFAVAFLVGTRVVPGRLERTAAGVVLTFDPLPEPPAIPQVSYEFIGVSVDLGASRTITKRVGRKGHKRKRTVRHSLVRTPAKCPVENAWPSTVALTFADASALALPAPIACRTYAVRRQPAGR